MNAPAKVEAKATESTADKLARLRKERAEREAARADKRVEREVEREELAARFEAELGPEGSEFAIVDSGIVGDPIVVLKRPALVQWTTYEQSQQTPTDRYHFVVPSVVHPPQAEYNAFREKRIGVELLASNALAVLMGAAEGAARGK